MQVVTATSTTINDLFFFFGSLSYSFAIRHCVAGTSPPNHPRLLLVRFTRNMVEVKGGVVKDTTLPTWGEAATSRSKANRGGTIAEARRRGRGCTTGTECIGKRGGGGGGCSGRGSSDGDAVVQVGVPGWTEGAVDVFAGRLRRKVLHTAKTATRKDDTQLGDIGRRGGRHRRYRRRGKCGGWGRGEVRWWLEQCRDGCSDRCGGCRGRPGGYRRRGWAEVRRYWRSSRSGRGRRCRGGRLCGTVDCKGGRGAAWWVVHGRCRHCRQCRFPTCWRGNRKRTRKCDGGGRGWRGGGGPRW